MNKSIGNVLIFTFGATVGSVVTYFSVKKYFENRADKEIEQVKNAYNSKVREFEGVKSSLNGDIKGPEEIDDGPVRRSLIVEKLNNKPPLTDYTKYFKKKDEESEEDRDKDEEDLKAESEHPEEDIPYTEEEDKKESIDFIDYKLNGDHKSAIADGKEPFIIDRSDFELTCDHYDKISLVYYISDDVLCEDTGEEINRFDYVGGCIESSGFSEDDVDELFVRNDRLTTDYEITKVYTKYGE